MIDKHPVITWLLFYFAFLVFVVVYKIFGFDPAWFLTFLWYDKEVRGVMNKEHKRKP